jgi:DNA-binding winged helix-turn-helix (wHTH) protein
MVRFGPFAIDRRTWTLTRNGVTVDLSPRLVEILAHLVEQNGAIVTKEDLLDRFWPDVNVTENTVARAIADLRKALSDSAAQPTVIQTLARRGYRFVGTSPSEGPAEDPFQQWVAGRLALETLDPSRLHGARAAMEAAVAAMPDYAPAHAGMANACVVSFEATRPRNEPDGAAIATAVRAARRAVELDPRLGEAWAVLGHAQALSGVRPEGQASLRRALALEPGNWRHYFRMALVSWGEERLRAADRALALLPSCAAAHLLSAMVFVARGAWTRAQGAADAGARLQDAQLAGSVLPAAGLHWMRGLVLSGSGHLAAAATAFSAEAEARGSGLYASEFGWLAHSSLGYLALYQGSREQAAASFQAAERFNEGGARSTAGLQLSGLEDDAAVLAAVDALVRGHKPADAALVKAAWLAWRSDADSAIDLLVQLIAGDPPGPVGWAIGADPMFLCLRDHPRWTSLLAAIAARSA